jgi:hypothetical protein
MASDWASLCRRDRSRTLDLTTVWADRYQAMRLAQRQLMESGRWRGGPRTLLAAIGVEDSELKLTAGLAWLLRPDGHHGLGTAMLSRLLALLGIDGSAGDVRITREESRGDHHGVGLERITKADLVIYATSWTIICESKIYAFEQDRQLDRLYRHWNREVHPLFLFLTRGPREPVSAGESRAHWHLVSWGEIAELARDAAEASDKVAAGVSDYIETLESHHHA